MSTEYLLKEKVSMDKWVYDQAEKAYYCKLSVVSELKTTIKKKRIKANFNQT